MARDNLKNRDNWQTESGPAGLSGQAEQSVIDVFSEAFENTDYQIIKSPKNLKHIYDNVVLPLDTQSKIYTPSEKTLTIAKERGWGVTPDFCIMNKKTGKFLFGEIKRQDGWVEGGTQSDGRGNAHERMCKLFSPGLIKVYRSISKIEDVSILPFWVIFMGNITRDPKRNREIYLWFDSFQNNYYMWRPNTDGSEMVKFFFDHLAPYLEN
ncbi:MunI family type II restriction endonuclease [Veillonella caviae]|uniref:MunI family type II restriction endonuclease n=1 Tax=Veillonella caviae TaxID=248316 RepID=UPI002352C508|nr:MunI family type II restriction endonuclease [Veillonella caviae]